MCSRASLEKSPGCGTSWWGRPFGSSCFPFTVLLSFFSLHILPLARVVGIWGILNYAFNFLGRLVLWGLQLLILGIHGLFYQNLVMFLPFWCAFYFPFTLSVNKGYHWISLKFFCKTDETWDVCKYYWEPRVYGMLTLHS